MESGTSANLQQIERKLLAAFERHAADGRAMTIESLAATAGIAGRPKVLTLALKHLIERGLLRRAGEDPIPARQLHFALSGRRYRNGLARQRINPRPVARLRVQPRRSLRATRQNQRRDPDSASWPSK